MKNNHSRALHLAIAAALGSSIFLGGCSDAPSNTSSTTSAKSTNTSVETLSTISESQRLATFFQQSFDEDVAGSPI